MGSISNKTSQNAHDKVATAIQRTIDQLREQYSLAQRAAMGDTGVVWRVKVNRAWGPWRPSREDCPVDVIVQYLELGATNG